MDEIEELFKNLWKEYIEYLRGFKVGKDFNIFAHNLGSFDGFFLFKGLIKNVSPCRVNWWTQ